MYCDQTGNNLVTSPDWGINNYPDLQSKEYYLRVEEGYVIEILFTDFDLEDRNPADQKCWDWVKIEDADGTELMAEVRMCDNTNKYNFVSVALKVLGVGGLGDYCPSLKN